MRHTNSTLTVKVDKKTLKPTSQIPYYKHHRFYWYLAMIYLGKGVREGKHIDSLREPCITHMMEVRNAYLNENSWDETIKKQFESAFKITKQGQNNFFLSVKDQPGDCYTFNI